MFTVIGLAFAIIVKVSEYPMGTPSRMGPGYFPFVLGSIMAVLGGIIVFQALMTSGGAGNKNSRRGLIFGVSPFLVFCFFVQPRGFLVAPFFFCLIFFFFGRQ